MPDVKTYLTNNPQTSSKNIKLILMMVLVGVIFYFIPTRHGPRNPALSLIFTAVVQAYMFYIFFVKKQVVQITINPTQNTIETLHQNGLNQEKTITQPLNHLTTEYLNYSTRGGKRYTLVLKDRKNIIRIEEGFGFTTATLLEIKQIIDSHNPKG